MKQSKAKEIVLTATELSGAMNLAVTAMFSCNWMSTPNLGLFVVTVISAAVPSV